MNRSAITVVFAAAVVAAAGCAGPDRLTVSHGVSYSAAFAAQQARPDRASSSTAPEGLDSQEAAIVAESYRRGLAPKEEKVDEPPVLILTPQKENHASMLPAPSVPK